MDCCGRCLCLRFRSKASALLLVFSSYPDVACYAVQTVHDMLEAQQAPEKLLEYSDVDFCPESNEPATLEAIPEKLKYLMVIGGCPHLLYAVFLLQS